MEKEDLLDTLETSTREREKLGQVSLLVTLLVVVMTSRDDVTWCFGDITWCNDVMIIENLNYRHFLDHHGVCSLPSKIKLFVESRHLPKVSSPIRRLFR